MDVKGGADLMFTASVYIPMLDTTLEQIKEGKKNGIDRNKLAELYGIYYNLFAGILRAGTVMYKKEMEDDGYATIVMNINDKNYASKDSAIRDILREEYDVIVHPYEDNSLSWVKPYDINGIELSLMRKEVEKEVSKKGFKMPFAPNGSKLVGGDIQGVDIPVGYDQKTTEGGAPVVLAGPEYSEKLPELFRDLDSIGGIIKSRLLGIAVAAVIMAAALIMI